MSVRKGALNIAALACIQGSNALVPILIFPYALKILGSSAYAGVAVAEAMSNVVLAFVLYSFDIDGVFQISSLDREADKTEVSKIYTNIFYARFAIFVIAATAVLGGVAVYTGHWPVIQALWLLVPLGYIFHAFWLYQGLEANAPAAAFTILGRAASVATVFVTLRGPSDAWKVPLAIGGAFLLTGIMSTLYANLSMGLRLRRPEWAEVASMMRHGKEIFLANACVLLYRGSNLLVLGALGVASQSVAAYSIAEKSTMMLQAITRPLTQFFFPRLLRRLQGASGPNRATARIIAMFTAPQIAILTGIVALLALATAGLWTFTHVIQSYPHSLRIMTFVAIMIPSTFFGIGNFMFGSAGLSFLGARAYFLGAVFLTGVLNVVACVVLGRWLGALGAAVTFASAEGVLFLAVISKYRRPAPRPVMS